MFVSPVPLVKLVLPASDMNYNLSTALIYKGVYPVYPIDCRIDPITFPFALIYKPFIPVWANSYVFESVDWILLSGLFSYL